MNLSHLRAGIIGTGFIGPVHLEALKRLGVQVNALCGSRDSALALVGLLLGSGPRTMNGATAWTHAVPGGRRTITLAPASDPMG